MSTAPRIAICVVTYNSAALIEDLVASLPAGGTGTAWHLVVADNASSDDTLDAVAHWAPGATVVRTGANLGYAAGLNAAVRAAGDCDAYLLLNADVRLRRGCVAALHAALTEGVGIVVPRLLDARGELIWSMRRRPTLRAAWADALLGAERAGRLSGWGEVVTVRSRYDRPGATDWAEGSTQLISRECWEACGPWDEDYFLYSEETAFALRADDRGFTTWYTPDAVATHLEGESADSPRLWSLLVVNRVRLFRRRHGPVAAGLFWLAAVTREASRALRGRATSRAALRDLLSPRRLRERPGPGWLDGVRV